MIDVVFLQHQLQLAPAGFGHSDVGLWLQDIPHIDQLASLKSLFFTMLSRKEWLALMVVLNQRYIKDGPAYNFFEDHFQHYIKHNELQDGYKNLSLYEDKSCCLDFFKLGQLVKLIISASRQVETIKLPVKSELEAVDLSYLPNLTQIHNIEQAKSLMYLTINHCSELGDFSFIKKLKKLVYLDLSANKQLTDLSFLLSSSSIVVLQLLETQLLDCNKTIKHLLKLKHLRYLTIAGKQAQIAELREQLPDCIVNGMSAFNTKLAFSI